MIIFVGDIHGDWNKFNSFMNEMNHKHKQPITFIICGDVAYFWMFESIPRVKVPKDCRVIWIPGNHENWEEIDKFPLGKIHELQDNVFLASFGAIEEIEGRKILFCGGAESIDKNMRTPFIDWFPQEIITHKDMNYILDLQKQKVDILVSHTCANMIVDKLTKEFVFHEKQMDPSMKALDLIVEKFNPNFCIFGHFHKYFETTYNSIQWIGLSYLKSCFLYYKIFI